MKIEIDNKSGFCFGVRNAIAKAEEIAAKQQKIISLGEIVHNSKEVERLGQSGIETVNASKSENITNSTVLIRTHGEPPSTYEKLLQNNNTIVDATCPVVLKLQQRVKKSYTELAKNCGQLVIYGKAGHPEVIGLNGQTENKAILIAGVDDLGKIDFSLPIELYCQTTMPIDGFETIKNEIQKRAQNTYRIHDSICRQVANRVPHLKSFSAQYGVVVFVSGKNSSNGKFLFGVCQKSNPNSYFVSGTEDVQPEWFANTESIGICGATSTPQWLMEKVMVHINNMLNVS